MTRTPTTPIGRPPTGGDPPLDKMRPGTSGRASRAGRLLRTLFADRTLTKRASLNSLAAVLDYGARFAVGFVLNPLLVGGLGSSLFGAWQFLKRTTGYVTAAGGRPTQALKLAIANSQSSDDYDEKRRRVGSAVVVWLLFLPLLALFGGLFAWLVPVWLGAPAATIWTIRAAAGVLVLNLVCTNLCSLPKAVLRGENREYKRMGMSSLLVLFGGGLMALALYLQTGLIGVAASVLATTLLTGMLFTLIVRRHVPWFGIARPTREEVKDFLGLSWWFLAWKLIRQLMLAGDVLLLGLFSSLELVTVYTLTKYAPEMLIGIITTALGGALPGLGGIIGAGDHQRAAKIRREMFAFSWLIATAVGATVVLWNGTFVGLWVGPEFYAGLMPTLLIMLTVAQFILIRNDALIIDLTLELKSKVLIGVVSSVLSLGLAGALVGLWGLGITGLCVGLLAGRLLLSVAYPRIVGRLLGIDMRSQFASLARPLAVTLVVIVGVIIAADQLEVRTWVGLLTGMAATMVATTAVLFFAGLTHDQRHILKRRMRRMLEAG